MRLSCTRWRIAAIMAFVMVAAACGNNEPAATTAAPAPATTAAPAPATTAAPTTTAAPAPATAAAPPTTVAAAPVIPDVPVKTVKINISPYYAYNMWAAARDLGIAGELNIDIEMSVQGFLATAALARGDVDLVTSCPACAFAQYESVPDFRNWLTTYQWRGFHVIGRQADGASVHPTWTDFLAEADGDQQAANVAFATSLKGRSFAIWEVTGTGTLTALLDQGGLTLDDVELITFADLTVASAAFVAGEGDYHMGDAVQVSRMLTAPDLAGKFVMAAPFQAFGDAGLWYSTFASTEGWLADNEETALRLLAIWYRTTRYLHNRTELVLPSLHEAVRRAGGVLVDDDALREELFNVEAYVRLQDAWDWYFAPDSLTNMDLSVDRHHKIQVELGGVPADSDWRTFEVEKQWFEKLLARQDLVDWVMSPLP